MRRPRFTVRNLMLSVGLIALVLWMGMVARELRLEPDYHFHVSVVTVKGQPGISWDDKASPPFWPRYWRRLLGRPWKGRAVCSTREGHLVETCSFVHPEMIPPTPHGGRLLEPPEVMAAYDRLQADWDHRQGLGKSTDMKSN